MTGRVGLPALRVEVGFDGTVADLKAGAEITWSDVTKWLRVKDGVSWQRGRTSESDTVAAGRAQVTLNTRHADGTSFCDGQLRQRTPLRIVWAGPVATYDSTATYDVVRPYDGTSGGGGSPFTDEFSDEFGEESTGDDGTVLWLGTVDDWGGGWTGGIRPFTTITCSDLVARMNARTLEALPVQTILAVGDVAWLYPMDEESGAMSAADRAPAAAPRLTVGSVGTGGGADFGGGYSPGSLPSEAESTVLALAPTDHSNYRYLSTGSLPPIRFGDTFTVHVMLLPTTTDPATPIVVQSADGGTQLAVGVNGTGKPTVTLSCGVGGPATVTAAATISDDDWTHLAVVVTNTGTFDDDNTTVTLYVNGTTAGSATATMIYNQLTRMYVGALGAYTGNVANLACHTRALTGGEITRIANGRTGWAGETTTARFARIANAAGWSGVTVGTGMTVMSAMPTKGDTLAAALSKIADTEVAPWWVDGTGRLRFEGRGYRYAAAAAFTLPASTLDPGTQVAASDVGVVNKVTASRPGGSQVTRVNQASIDDLDEYAADLTLYVQSDADLEAMAEGIVNTKADPQLRSDTLDVDLHVAAAGLADQTAAVLADTGDRATVTGLPADISGLPDPWDVFVEGVADNVTTAGWKRTFNVSPVSTYTVMVLDSPTYARLDGSARLGF